MLIVLTQVHTLTTQSRAVLRVLKPEAGSPSSSSLSTGVAHHNFRIILLLTVLSNDQSQLTTCLSTFLLYRLCTIIFGLCNIICTPHIVRHSQSNYSQSNYYKNFGDRLLDSVL